MPSCPTEERIVFLGDSITKALEGAYIELVEEGTIIAAQPESKHTIIRWG